ncbi:MAG: DnaD domain protein [Bacilli bacterium]|nr:DnaD domain protein [Bacilli bacterium]
MAVFRVEKADNYTAMSNYHLRDKHLSLKAKGLLSFMLSLPDDWDYSMRGLAANCKEEKSTIERTLKELKDNNYLTIKKLLPNETKTGRIEYEYTIYETPQKTRPQKQGIEKQGLENGTLLNTNIQNTKKLNNTTTTPIGKGVVDFVEENFGRTLAPIEYEEIQNWEDNELTRYAIKQAVLNSKYSIKYISKILYEYQKSNIKTVQQAQQREEEYANRKKQPKTTYRHFQTRKEREEEAMRKFLEEDDD